jgi:hypothetical protein
MEKTFDEMMSEVKAGDTGGGRKLTFKEKCGVFAALYDGASNKLISRAFDLSVQTVSKLSGCLDVDPEPWQLEYDGVQNPDLERPKKVFRDYNGRRKPNRHMHYADVAREFHAIGREEFNRRYYTPLIHDRIMRAKRGLK